MYGTLQTRHKNDGLPASKHRRAYYRYRGQNNLFKFLYIVFLCGCWQEEVDDMYGGADQAYSDHGVEDELSTTAATATATLSSTASSSSSSSSLSHGSRNSGSPTSTLDDRRRGDGSGVALLEDAVAEESGPQVRLVGRGRCLGHKKMKLALLFDWMRCERQLLYTLLGIMDGFVVGLVFSRTNPSPTLLLIVGLPGELLLRALKCVVLPLVVASLIQAISTTPVKQAGGMGVASVVYYGMTTLLAAFSGVMWVTLFQPGHVGEASSKAQGAGARSVLLGGESSAAEMLGWTSSVSAQSVASTLFTAGANSMTPAASVQKRTALDAIVSVLHDLCPDNLAAAAVEFNILGLITFSAAFGVALTKLPAREAKPLIDWFGALNKVCMKLVHWLLWCIPVGVGSLVAVKLGSDQEFWEHLSQILMFAMTVCTALFVHTFIILPVLMVVLTRKNPFRLFARMSQSFMVAIGTSSSAAALPLTMRCLEEKQKLSELAVRFMVPLGTVVNLNGTALYESIAALYIAQSSNIELSVAQTVVVTLTAALAALGAAPVPEAGLVTIVMVLTAVDLPLEGVGLLFSIDWMLGRLRTVCNIYSDCVGCCIVDHWLDQKKKKKTEAQ